MADSAPFRTLAPMPTRPLPIGKYVSVGIDKRDGDPVSASDSSAFRQHAPFIPRPLFCRTWSYRAPFVDRGENVTPIPPVIPPSITTTFYQYDGPFTWPGFAFPGGPGGGGDGDPVIKYFLEQSVTGTTFQKFSPIGNDVSAKTCSLVGDDAATGKVEIYWGGSVAYSIEGVFSGFLSAGVYRYGGIGAYDFPGTGTVTLLTASSLDGLFTAVAGAKGYYSFSSYYENYSDDLYIKFWSAYRDSQGGYFAGSFGGVYNNVWCAPSVLTVTSFNFISAVELGHPVARTGSAAQTQTTSGMDTGTRTLSGNLSRMEAVIDVNESKPTATVEVTFLVTPATGDPYTIVKLQEIAITGPTITYSDWFPAVNNGTVVFQSISFSYLVRAFDDFETYNEGWYEYLDAAPSWDAVAEFGAPAPNTRVYDDFERYDAGVTSTYLFGWGWDGSGTSSSVDYTRVYDDFEAYADGALTTLSQGVGWLGFGSCTIVTYGLAWDAFETYADGAITVLDYTATGNLWSGDGSIG